VGTDLAVVIQAAGALPHATVTTLADFECEFRAAIAGNEAAMPVAKVETLAPEPRRRTVLATPDGPDRHRFDVILQGPGETVFLDV
jgi:hypothetical protein